MLKFISIFLILTLGFNHASSQSIFVGGLFPTIEHSGKFTKHLDYSFYYFGSFPLIQFNQRNISKNANFLLFYSEQALTYNVNNKLSFSGSYVYQRENVTSNNYFNENRIHIQASYKHEANSINVKHRLRFDNRFIHNTATGETPYTHRLRYLIGLNIPVGNRKKNLYFTAYEEVFFNTFRNARAFYAENWAYAAIGFNLNNNNKIESGPLYITWNTGSKSWFNQYYLQLTWISSVDFTKKNSK